MIDAILADLFARARKHGWLVADKAGISDNELVQRAQAEILKAHEPVEGDRPSLRQKALVQNIIEYMRPVHGELAAITTASRLGISVAGATLYCTTFPCHECAKNIVAAGIRKVVFIEPYPKSRVADMFDEEITVDQHVEGHVAFESFVGIAPGKYVDLFTAPVRKREGKWVKWEVEKRTSQPRHALSHAAYLYQETDKLDALNARLEAQGLRQEAGDQGQS
jgi:cytidine deaminase